MNIEQAYLELGISLSPVGDKWRSICPFHNETNESFYVYSDGSYYCFGCKAHGTYKSILEYFGEDSCYRNCSTISTIKEKDILDINKRREILENDVINKISKYNYEKKVDIWKDFDSIWEDIRFMEMNNDVTILDISIFLNKKIEQLNDRIKNAI